MKFVTTAILALAVTVAGCDRGAQQKPEGKQVSPAPAAGTPAPAAGQPAAAEAAPGTRGAAAQPTAEAAKRGPAPTPTGPVAKVDYPTKGSANPKVHIIEVSEFQCPFCRRVLPTVKKIHETYGDDVAVSFVHNPLPFHKDARPAAIASAAAGKQGKFWEYHDIAFENQRALKPADLERYASQIGLDMEQFKKDMKDPALGKWVDMNQRMSQAVGATGTPSFFINGKNLRGAQPFEQFKAVIDAELKAANDAGKAGMDWIKARTKTNNDKLAGFYFEGKEPPKVAKREPKPRPVDKTVYKVTVRDNDPVKGNAKGALVTLVEFSDFQCPFCTRVNPTIKQIMDKYGDDVRIIFKHQPLPFHKDAGPAAESSMCAHDQGKFWEMHDKLFANQKALKPADLERYAGELSLDVAKWKKCMDSGKYKKWVEEDQELAGKVTARGTPNIFVNGRKVTGAKPFDEFKTVIDEELAKAKKLVEGGIKREDVYAEIIKNGKVFEPLESKVNTFSLKAGEAIMGKPNAPVQIVEFSDFQCPFCARVGNPLKQVKKHYGDKVAIAFKQFPLSFHKQAKAAAQASICAEKQGKFWEMHDVLFAKQKELAQEKWSDWAVEAGADKAKFDKCMADNTFEERINAEMAEGRKAGVRGTPTIFINGRKFTSPSGYNLRAFTTVIDKHILNK